MLYGGAPHGTLMNPNLEIFSSSEFQIPKVDGLDSHQPFFVSLHMSMHACQRGGAGKRECGLRLIVRVRVGAWGRMASVSHEQGSR